MKKLSIAIALLFCSSVINAQVNTTAKGALDAVSKYFSAFDTINAFTLLKGKMAKKVIKGIRKSVKEESPQDFNEKVEDTKSVFTSMQVLETIETDSLVAFKTQYKKHTTSKNVNTSYLIFSRIESLWYLVLFDDDEEDVLEDFPAFNGKITVPKKKDE